MALLRSKYGADKVIPATIAVESERVAARAHRSPLALRPLECFFAGAGAACPTVDQLQKMGFECRFIDDEATLMWSKLVFLAAFALCHDCLGQDHRRNSCRSRMVSTWHFCACAKPAQSPSAEGAKIDADAMIAGVMKMPGNMRSSMQKDVEHGNPPELDAIAGPILRGGQKHRIQVPATKKLVEMVERKVDASRP